MALADRDADGAAAVAAVLLNPSVIVPVDITDTAQVTAMVEAVLDAFGCIDVAVLMPGTNVRKPALDLADDEWERVIELNLSGMFRSARAVASLITPCS